MRRTFKNRSDYFLMVC